MSSCNCSTPRDRYAVGVADSADTFRLNGEPQPLPSPATVSGLLAQLKLDAGKVAVERNRRLVRGDLYDDTPIEPGDEIEIVTFVGGG
jgi:thiamine biosynthesis protein ThiS